MSSLTAKSGKTGVLHVLAPGRTGGLEYVVAMLAAAQRTKCAHVAAVLSPEEADAHQFVSRLSGLNVPVTVIPVAGRQYLEEYHQLGDLIARLDPTVVHTHGYRADVIAGFLARRRRIPAVSTVHGFTSETPRNRFYERIQLIALRRADAVIAVSRPMVTRLTAGGVAPEKIHCVPNAFSPSDRTESRVVSRQRLGIPPSAVVVGWVGRFSREKGADVMLDAFALSDASWRLSMIGVGPELVTLRQQARSLGIAERIVWHGLVENAGSLFSAFDAFVLSSRTEGTPISLFEAMHASVPIIATRVGGVPDVVDPSQAILVPSEQPSTIARALSEILKDPTAAARRSELAREKLRKSYDPAKWVAAIETVYEAARRAAGERTRG